MKRISSPVCDSNFVVALQTLVIVKLVAPRFLAGLRTVLWRNRGIRSPVAKLARHPRLSRDSLDKERVKIERKQDTAKPALPTRDWATAGRSRSSLLRRYPASPQGVLICR